MVLMGQPDGVCRLYDFISHFHVMALFAVSGFVWKRNAVGFWHSLKKNFIHLMVPYYIFAIFAMVIAFTSQFLIGGSVSPNYSLSDDIKIVMMAGRPNCYAPLWFMSCLFAVQTLYYWFSPILRHAVVSVLILILLAYIDKCSLGYLCKTPALNLVVIPRYFIMFAIGNLLGAYLRRSFVVSRFVRVGLFLAGVVVLLIAAQKDVFAFKFSWAFMIPLVAAVIVGATMAIAIAIDNKVLSWIGQGEMTLGILCLHKYPIVVMQKYLILSAFGSSESMVLPMSVLMSVVAVAFSIGGTIVITKHIPWMFGRISERK